MKNKVQKHTENTRKQEDTGNIEKIESKKPWQAINVGKANDDKLTKQREAQRLKYTGGAGLIEHRWNTWGAQGLGLEAGQRQSTGALEEAVQRLKLRHGGDLEEVAAAAAPTQGEQERASAGPPCMEQEQERRLLGYHVL